MALPTITHYFYAPYPADVDYAEAGTADWFPPSGVTSSTPPAGLVFYGLIFGPMTSVSMTPAGTSVSSGSVGGSNFFLFRRDTGPSEPANYRFDFDPILSTQNVVIAGFGVAGSALDVAGSPQFAIGDTATSDALTVPPGNVLSVHIWGGANEPPDTSVAVWTPDTTDFPDNRRFGYGIAMQQYAATIGEIRDAATAPGKAATLEGAPGADNFAIQFLFSDVAAGGWGVGMIRMNG